MTNEELREELWNLQSDMARMREHEPKARMRFFQIIREMATQHVDEHGSIQWEFIEKALFEPVQVGPITMIPYGPNERPRPGSKGCP
jgi:hypothetical protein